MKLYIVKEIGTVFHLNEHCQAAPGKLVPAPEKEKLHTGIKRICLRCRKAEVEAKKWVRNVYSTYP